MEKILKKANELGHLLAKNEIVVRFKDLADKMEKSEESKELMNNLLQASQAFHDKEAAGTTIEVAEKKELAELQEKAKQDSLVNEFLATQFYYINILNQVNEAIAHPQGDPPKESDII
ncbi:MAG: YlbF family regulator, partial [Planctomycetota bacterium]